MQWQNSILGYLPKTTLLKLPVAVRTNTNAADNLFGDDYTKNMLVEWSKRGSRIPMVAEFHALDTEAKTGLRHPLDHQAITLALIKEKISQSEQLQMYIDQGMSDDDDLFQQTVEDLMNLATKVITRTKVAKNELLATGEVTIHENGLNLTVDFGVPNANKNVVFDISEGADFFESLSNVKKAANMKGTVIDGMMCSESMITRLKSTAAAQIAIRGQLSLGMTISRSQFLEYLATEYGIKTVIYNDDVYGCNERIDTSTGRVVFDTKRMYPEDKITFFSKSVSTNGFIGTGLWTLPPSARNRLVNSRPSGQNPWVYFSQWPENDPDVLWSMASTIFMPMLYVPESLFIATVVEYKAVENPTGNPSENGWYEKANGAYALTSDTTVQSGKTYYEKK